MPAAPKQPKSEAEAEQPSTLMAALLAVQAEVPKLQLGKDQSGQVEGNRKYKYLSLDKLMDEVLPLLNKHGLVWLTMPGTDEEGKPVLHYSLIHAPSFVGPEVIAGQQLPNQIAGTFPLMLDKSNSQGLGSALTYGRRYALTAVLGIVPDDDDDGAEASKESPKPVAVDRKLTDAEKATLTEAMEGQNLDLLIAAVGAETIDDVTVEQGREIFRRLRT